MARVVPAGAAGEKMARSVEIDVSEITQPHPNAVVSLLVQREGDEIPYTAANTSVDGGVLSWTPDATDTAVSGTVELQAVGIVGETVIAKTPVLRGRVVRSLGENEGSDPPSALDNWILALETAIASIPGSSTADDLAYIIG